MCENAGAGKTGGYNVADADLYSDIKTTRRVGSGIMFRDTSYEWDTGMLDTGSRIYSLTHHLNFCHHGSGIISFGNLADSVCDTRSLGAICSILNNTKLCDPVSSYFAARMITA